MQKLKFKKFLVCPNCGYPILKKKALGIIQDVGSSYNYCKGCGVETASIIKMALAENKEIENN